MSRSLSKESILVYAFLLALLFLAFKGYRFNSGDQAECLPQVYQLLDPGLYRNDFFMEEYQRAFTVRFYFVHLIHVLSLVSSVATVCFALLVFSLVSSIYFFIGITQHFTSSRTASLLSPLFAFFVFFNFVVGGNHLQSNIMVPGALSVVFALAGIHLFLRAKVYPSFLVLGIGTLFQPLVTLQVFMVLLIMLILNSRNGLMAVKAALVYLLPASFMLFPIVYRQFFQPASVHDPLYYELLFRFRNHLHYLPSLFPARDYLWFAALISAALLATRFTAVRNRRSMYLFTGIILFGMLGYAVLLEIVDVMAIGKLQWFKASIWANAMACIALAGFIGSRMDSFLKFNAERMVVPLSFIGSGMLLAVLLHSESLPIERLQYRYQIGNHRKSDLTLLHEWMNQNLPKDARILCSPSNTSLGCEAKRSQVVQYQAIIHEPFYMLEWYRRFKHVYGVGLETADRKDVRQQAADLYNVRNFKGDQYQIDYRIDNLATCQYAAELGRVVYKSGDYILTEFVPDP